jgi:hypothetical protein
MRKGQAAVEYLTTYGWALLALVIIIAVLFSSGVLSTNLALSEQCQFGTSMPCDFAVFNNATGTEISLRVFNGFAYRINVTGMELRTSDGSASFTWNGGAPPFSIESGDYANLTGTLSTVLPVNSVQDFYGNLTYASCAPEINGSECGVIPHTVTGIVTGKILSSG